MKTEIVLLFPPDTDKPYKDLEDAASILPPMGISYIAGLLREKGVVVRAIDGYAEGLSIDQTIDRILDENSPILGISMTSAVIFIGNEIAKRVKARNPNIVVLVGGPHISAVPQETMERMSNFDIGIIGEGELTCYELVEHLKNNNYEIDNLDGIDGIIYRKNEKIVKTKSREYTGVDKILYITRR